AGEIGDAARAVVQGIAGATDHAREVGPDAPEARDLRVDLVDLPREADAHRLGGPAGRPRPEMEVFLDLRQREPEALCLLHGPDEPHGVVPVRPVAGGVTRGVGKESPALVVAQGLHVHPGPPGDLADPHDLDCKPVPRYGLQVSIEARRTTRSHPFSGPAHSRPGAGPAGPGPGSAPGRPASPPSPASARRSRAPRRAP